MALILQTRKNRILSWMIASITLTTIILIFFTTTPANKADVAIEEVCKNTKPENCHEVKYTDLSEIFTILEKFNPVVQDDNSILDFHQNNTLRTILMADEELSAVFVIQEKNSIAGPQTTRFFLIKERSRNQYHVRIAK